MKILAKVSFGACTYAIQEDKKGRVYIDSWDPIRNVSLERWCEVLGSVGVDLRQRGIMLAYGVDLSRRSRLP